MITSGSFLDHFQVKVFFCILALTGLGGCSQTPKIYKLPPEQVEDLRSDLGTIGVTISYYPLKRKIIMPAKGFVGGAVRGFGMGAAAPVAIGAVSPVPGGILIGVLISPITAVAGSVYGAIKALPAEDFDKAVAAGNKAVERLQKMNLRRFLLDEVVRTGMERTGTEFVTLLDVRPQDPKEFIRYDQMDIRGIDTILELRAETTGLKGIFGIDPLSIAFIEVRARLIQVSENKVLIKESFFCASEERRKYTEWAKNEGQLFVDEFITCLPYLAEKIVDDFFMVYPISTR